MTYPSQNQFEFMRKIIGGEYTLLSSNPQMMAMLSGVEVDNERSFFDPNYSQIPIKFLTVDDVFEILKGEPLQVISLPNSLPQTVEESAQTFFIDSFHPLITCKGEAPKHFRHIDGVFSESIHGRRFGGKETNWVHAFGECSYNGGDGKMYRHIFDNNLMIVPTMTLYEHFVKVLSEYGLEVDDGNIKIAENKIRSMVPAVPSTSEHKVQAVPSINKSKVPVAKSKIPEIRPTIVAASSTKKSDFPEIPTSSTNNIEHRIEDGVFKYMTTKNVHGKIYIKFSARDRNNGKTITIYFMRYHVSKPEDHDSEIYRYSHITEDEKTEIREAEKLRLYKIMFLEDLVNENKAYRENLERRLEKCILCSPDDKDCVIVLQEDIADEMMPVPIPTPRNMTYPWE